MADPMSTWTRKPPASPRSWSSFTRPARSKASKTLHFTRTWSVSSAPALLPALGRRTAYICGWLSNRENSMLTSFTEFA